VTGAGGNAAPVRVTPWSMKRLSLNRTVAIEEYLPGVQPIERLWAYVKNYVASQYHSGRTMPQLLQQTYKGFYGDGQHHAGVTVDLSANVIRHSMDYCNYLIEQDDSLDGDIHNLKTELTAMPTDIVEDIDADMAPFPGVVEE
jgi:transposase